MSLVWLFHIAAFRIWFFSHSTKCRCLWKRTTTVAFVAVIFWKMKVNGKNMVTGERMKDIGFSCASLASSISGDCIRNLNGMKQRVKTVLGSTKITWYFWNMRWPSWELISSSVQSLCNFIWLPTLFFHFEFNSFYNLPWWKNKLES